MTNKRVLNDFDRLNMEKAQEIMNEKLTQMRIPTPNQTRFLFKLIKLIKEAKLGSKKM